MGTFDTQTVIAFAVASGKSYDEVEMLLERIVNSFPPEVPYIEMPAARECVPMGRGA